MDLLTPEFGLFLWTLVAFVIVFLILKKYAWGFILKSLNDRESNIADAIASAERLKKDMADMKSENEQIMQAARTERSLILKEAKEASDKMINQAKEQAKVEAAKILADAQEQIHQQKMVALTDVKNQIGKLSVEVAEKVLRKQLASSDEQMNYAKMLAEDVKLN